MRALFLLVLTVVTAFGASTSRGQDLPRVSQAPGELMISADSLMAHVKWLADDARQGRGTGTPAEREAAAWLARKFEARDLEPAGDDGTYFQDFQATVGVLLAGDNRLSLNGRDLQVEEDYIPFGFTDNGSIVDSSPVFVGYGITDDDSGYDDYAGIDVEGKTVIMLRHEPQIDDPHSVFAGDAFSGHATFRSKAENARNHGASAMILITGPESPEYEEDELVYLSGSEGTGGSGVLAVHVKHDLVEPMLQKNGIDLKEWVKAVDASLEPDSKVLDAVVKLSVQVEKDRRTARNVVARLPGRNSDAGTLVIGAHYDHLGLGKHSSLAPDRRGHVHNGADDNASGTAALLELARVFQITGPVERDLVFVAFSGEELGLLGSAHYVDHPTVPLEDMQAMINLDMIARPQKNTITLGGVGSSPAFPALLETLKGSTELSITKDSSGFGASDHTSFYAEDVPVLFFFSGLHEDYHRPSDDWDKITPGEYAEVVRLVYSAALDLANRPQELAFTRAVKDSLGPHGSGSPSSGSGGGGYGPYLGTIPSFGDREEPGVELSGVREGSPAEKAGIQGGDVVIRFAGKDITDLYAYTYALRDHKPGDVVEVVVLRDGKEVVLTATLGRRE